MRGKRILRKIFTLIGAVLCVMLGFILVCNLVLHIKKAIDPNMTPTVFGVTPMVVRSQSMSGDAADSINQNDLIFVMRTDIDKLKMGDVIAFYDDNIIVSHRIVEVGANSNGAPYFITKGDANDAADQYPVTSENFIGIVRGHIPRVGGVILFLQRPLGLTLFGILPLVAVGLLGIASIIRKRKPNDSKCQSES